MSSWGLTIKLIDRLANITDNPTTKMLEDTYYIIDELSINRKLSKTQHNIVKDIIEIIEKDTQK